MRLFWLSTQTADGADLYPASDRIARALPQVEEGLSDSSRERRNRTVCLCIPEERRRSRIGKSGGFRYAV